MYPPPTTFENTQYGINYQTFLDNHKNDIIYNYKNLKALKLDSHRTLFSIPVERIFYCFYRLKFYSNFCIIDENYHYNFLTYLTSKYGVSSIGFSDIDSDCTWLWNDRFQITLTDSQIIFNYTPIEKNAYRNCSPYHNKMYAAMRRSKK